MKRQVADIAVKERLDLRPIKIHHARKCAHRDNAKHDKHQHVEGRKARARGRLRRSTKRERAHDAAAKERHGGNPRPDAAAKKAEDHSEHPSSCDADKPCSKKSHFGRPFQPNRIPTSPKPSDIETVPTALSSLSAPPRNRQAACETREPIVWT